MNTTYFNRTIDQALLAWKDDPRRKPLLLRGARQVGKSAAIRHLGKTFDHFVEVNFDEDKAVRGLFDRQQSPRELCAQLALYYNTPIEPGRTLLFFDEIQSCPAALAALRYFYERHGSLHLAAAGSLLEFAIEEIPTFAVGRLRSLFLYPFSFAEFLGATGCAALAQAAARAGPLNPLPEPLHQKLVEKLKTFFITGGMPEAVAEYAATGDFLKTGQVHTDLLLTYRDDFAKYKAKGSATLINEVFESVVRQAPGKFVYERAVAGAGVEQVKKSLNLLIMAGLVYPVTHTSGNGIPLGAEANIKFRKMLPCDTGLFLHLLGLNPAQLLVADDTELVNRGALAEIFAGLELLKHASCFEPARLYYWHREKRQSSAEIDYLVQAGGRVIPIEVKAGTQGAMQSLRLFMREKNIPRGIRASLENFRHLDDIDVYPLYAIGARAT